MQFSNSVTSPPPPPPPPPPPSFKRNSPEWLSYCNLCGGKGFLLREYRWSFLLLVSLGRSGAGSVVWATLDEGLAVSSSVGEVRSLGPSAFSSGVGVLAKGFSTHFGGCPGPFHLPVVSCHKTLGEGFTRFWCTLIKSSRGKYIFPAGSDGHVVGWNILVGTMPGSRQLPLLPTLLIWEAE